MMRPIKSLSELMDGSVEERFNLAMAQVWDNVQDPNTKPTATREIVLRVKIIPNERRDSAEFRVGCSTRLAAPTELSQTVFLQFDGLGGVTATERTENIPGQMKMDGTEVQPPKVISFEPAPQTK